MRSFTWNRFPIKICDWFLAYFTCGAKLLECRYAQVWIIAERWKQSAVGWFRWSFNNQLRSFNFLPCNLYFAWKVMSTLLQEVNTEYRFGLNLFMIKSSCVQLGWWRCGAHCNRFYKIAPNITRATNYPYFATNHPYIACRNKTCCFSTFTFCLFLNRWQGWKGITISRRGIWTK